MRSSISSSETAAERLPRLHWIALLGGALMLAGSLVVLLELTLAARGFRPTIVDSQGQWEKQRARAAALGTRALILVGDSRMLTDFDLGVLGASTGLAPVQLGIDGSPFLPLLAGLARDPDIRGTVLVGFSDAEVMRDDRFSTAMRYEADYEKRDRSALLPDYRTSETLLADQLHGLLASYADGARPLTTLLLRALDSNATPQSIVTQPDRSRIVDYSNANLRSLNQKSAMFELDGNLDALPKTDLDGRERYLQERINALRPANVSDYIVRLQEIESLVQAIQSRSGHVIFVTLPVSGYIPPIDARRYPRNQFWDRFAERSSARCIRIDDSSQLREFAPPDGLHLDGRDRARFTATLGQMLVRPVEK